MLDPAKSAPSMAADSASEFDVFVSYSRKDKDFCALLEDSLRAYKPPGGLIWGSGGCRYSPTPAIYSAPTTKPDRLIRR